MGWSFSYIDIGKAAHIEQVTSQSHYSAGYTPLEYRVVGNNVWQLLRIEATGRVMVTLNLIAKEKGAGWGYKGISEDMGPGEVNCPLSLLDKASPVTEADSYAAEWRNKVREYHAAKAIKASNPPAVGTVVECGGAAYRLTHNLGRKGWNVQALETGKVYRMSARLLAAAKTVHPPKPAPQDQSAMQQQQELEMA